MGFFKNFLRGVGAVFTLGTSELVLTATKGKPKVPVVPEVPDTLSETNIETSQANAERTELKKRAAALTRSQVNFTSSLGSPISSLPKSFKTALGGFGRG